MVNFYKPLAFARDYPEPIVFGTPKLTHKQLAKSQRPQPDNVGKTLLVNQARTGFYLLARVLQGKTVWLPAYHCPALVEPFIAQGVDIRFYGINADLTANLATCQSRFKDGDVFVAVRFFGFECGVQDVKSWLSDYPQSLLIEDLAHAAFATELFGTVGVTSLVKFYPVTAGSEIWIEKMSPIEAKLETQFKSLSGRVGMLGKRIARKFFSEIRTECRYFKAERASKVVGKHSLSILEHTQHEMVKQKRRSNYMALLNALQDSPWGSPLFSDLGAETVPYVLPFQLNNEAGFHHVRLAGVQIYRWEEMVEGLCEISDAYRHTLIQLPVHQDLEAGDLEQIIMPLCTLS